VPRNDHQVLGTDFGARVRELRTARKWSLQSLSQASGVSRSMLSEIERGEANPTLALALAISRALGTRLGELVDGGQESSLQVVRHNDPMYDYRNDDACRIRTLSPLEADRTIEYYCLDFARGGELRSQPHSTGTREIVYVDVGRVRIESGGDGVVLTAGDSVTFPADVPHAIVNVGRSRARAYLVDVFPNGAG
jgi:transcriptional regulator with XRE-family HTH domain